MAGGCSPRHRGLMADVTPLLSWLLVGIRIVIFVQLSGLAFTQYLMLSVMAGGYLLLKAADSSLMHWWGGRHRVEVSPCPPAIGDLIRIWVGNRRSNQQEAVMVRVYLIEHVLTRVGGISAWSEEILWDEPMYLAEVALQSPWRSLFVVRLPHEMPGTYLASGYQLEWMVEVRDDQVDISYALPVVP